MTKAQLIFQDVEVGEILPWIKVSELHKTRNGIYQRNGVLISLLTDFGNINPCYPDFTGETADEIFYTGAGRRGNQKLDVHNQSLHDAIKTQIAVPLFCKLKVNQWKFMGFWRVTDAEYIFDQMNERYIWSFGLKKEAFASSYK